MTRCYSSAVDFKQALEDRLRRGTTGFGIQRRRQLLVFQRLLARVASGFERSVVLKGGLCLEIRIDGARTTRDIDLVIFADEATILARLQALGQLDLGDFMTFEIQPDRTRAELTGDGLVYGGRRFRVECKLAGKIYGARFVPRCRVRRAHAGQCNAGQGRRLPRVRRDSRTRAAADPGRDPPRGEAARVHASTALAEFARARSARHGAPGHDPGPTRWPSYRRGDPPDVSSAGDPRCAWGAPATARVLADALRSPRRRSPASMACPRRTGPCRTGVPRSRPARGGLRPVAPRAVLWSGPSP
jgi:hypothetical protein